MSPALLESLTGQEVNGICFVMDYVELTFNGPILRCLAGPTLEDNGRTFVFPGTGYRDALCSLIGATVASIKIAEGDEIRLYFVGGAELSIPLDPEKLRGAEAAQFVPGIDSPSEVW